MAEDDPRNELADDDGGQTTTAERKHRAGEAGEDEDGELDEHGAHMMLRDRQEASGDAWR